MVVLALAIIEYERALSLSGFDGIKELKGD